MRRDRHFFRRRPAGGENAATARGNVALKRAAPLVLAICALLVCDAAHGATEDVAKKKAETTPAPKRKAASPTPKPKKQGMSDQSTPKPSEKKSGVDDAAKSGESGKTPQPTGAGKKETTDGGKKVSPKPKATPAPSAEDADAKTTAAGDPAAPPADKVPAAKNATISSSDLVEFAAQPPRVQALIESALALTRQNLTYTYGSADPTNGGMDCSGFVYYVLRQNGLRDVPRASNEQYVWVRKADEFNAVLSKKKQTFELDALRPGDLLFWTGTYSTERDPPVTHSMIYLGTERTTKQRVMVGSSDGRTYRGASRWGVSVFDFQGGQTSKDPAKAGRGGFVGYATIPGLR